MIRTSHAKNNAIPGMAYPLMVLVLATTASYPRMPDLINRLTEACGAGGPAAGDAPADGDAAAGVPGQGRREQPAVPGLAPCSLLTVRDALVAAVLAATPAAVERAHRSRDGQPEPADLYSVASSLTVAGMRADSAICLVRQDVGADRPHVPWQVGPRAEGLGSHRLPATMTLLPLAGRGCSREAGRVTIRMKPLRRAVTGTAYGHRP